MGKTISKGRNSSIELLRIVCIILIFWMHASGSYEGNHISAWISIAASVLGNIGVSCFILISGYYGIRLEAKKMLHLEAMMLFYAWSSLALQVLWGSRPGTKEAVTYLMPVIGKFSWYFTCYFALAFLSPFLNEMVEKLGEARLKSLLINMLVIFSGITTVFLFDINEDGGKGIVHMVMLYLIGRYIGVYKNDKKYKSSKLFGGFALLALINFCLNGAIYVLTGTVQNRYARDNTLFTIGEAVFIFLLFRNFYFENAFVNRLARHVPAAFLFEWSLRGIISHYFVDYLSYADSDFYELILIGIALLLVILGSIIDFMRILILHVPENWAVDKVEGALLKVRMRLKKTG